MMNADGVERAIPAKDDAGDTWRDRRGPGAIGGAIRPEAGAGGR